MSSTYIRVTRKAKMLLICNRSLNYLEYNLQMRVKYGIHGYGYRGGGDVKMKTVQVLMMFHWY